MAHEIYAKHLTNGELADVLEFAAPFHGADIAVAIMKESARRLRDEPEAHFVTLRPSDLPPLTAYAVAD